ncbi:MAG: hypothetical protein MOB07_17870 [Acidobacteria bacterium]|nr:hypothetical protein [Acidobacteriota bacterium]
MKFEKFVVTMPSAPNPVSSAPSLSPATAKGAIVALNFEGRLTESKYKRRPTALL